MALFTLHAFQVSHDGTELLGIYDFIINSELAEESYKIFIRSSQESNKEADTTVRTWWNNLPDTIKRSTNGVRRIPTEKSAIVDPGNIISGEGFFTKILPTYDFFGQPNFDNFQLLINAEKNTGQVINFYIRGEHAHFASEKFLQAITSSQELTKTENAYVALVLWWMKLPDFVKESVVMTKGLPDEKCSVDEVSAAIDSGNFAGLQYEYGFFNP